MLKDGRKVKFDDLNPERFMIAGDTHGSMPHMEDLFRWSKRYGVDVVFQVGDFGFIWPNYKKARNRRSDEDKWVYDGYPHNKTRLDSLDRMAARADVMIVWLDGNHEDFGRMEELGAVPHGDEPVQIATNVIYIPRGFAWSWNDVRFMAMGGAFSIDHGDRVHGVSWWPEETIKTQDVYRVEAEVEENGAVDVLLSHDAPEGSPELDHYLHNTPILGLPREFGLGYKLDKDSLSNRKALASVAELADPTMIFHGHYHHPYYGSWENPRTQKTARVVGLDRDKEGSNSFVIFDTNVFKEDPEGYWRNL